MQSTPQLKNGEITQEEYDMWRYRFPSMEPTAGWHRVMSFDTDDISKAIKKRFSKNKKWLN